MPGELPAAVPETEGFRALMTRFPTGVTVVTAMDGGGRPQGMTCSSLASVCLRPPTLLVCLRTLSATQRAVEATGAFAVNLLHSGGRTLAKLFASPIRDRFASVGWALSPYGTPWLVDGAMANADCVVVERVHRGDHVIVVGEVRHLGIRENQLEPPLLYGLRRFADFDGELSDQELSDREALDRPA